MKRLWQDAASFAARAHQGQVRKDGRTPYAAHPFRVAMTVRDVFGCADEVCLAAALLHDVIEDTGADYEDIAERFGEPVAACVAALTKDMRLPEPQRERAYDDALARADWRARLIKLADVYDNLCDLESPASLPKMLDKCRRALAIAEGARNADPAVPRGIEAVRALMGRSGPGAGGAG